MTLGVSGTDSPDGGEEAGEQVPSSERSGA